IVFLTGQLATLLRSGVTLERAFEILIELTRPGALRQMLGRILGRLRDGAALGDALGVEQRAFPGFYVSMVRAGESSGALDVVLARLAGFLIESQVVRDKIKSALIYPTIILAMVFITMVIVLTVVLPQFEVLFQESMTSLPWPTRAILAIGDVFEGYWWSFPVAFLVMLLGGTKVARRPGARLVIDRYLLKSKALFGLVAKAEVARFARALGTLLSSGVPVTQALWIAKDTISNLAMAEAVASVREGLKRGQGLAEPLASTKLFPVLAIQLLKVGEETGRLEEMLLETATIYEREVETTIERLLAILVPLLTVGLGLIVAALIGSVLVGILSVNDLAA
ncbi:MAG: type II secretion system F family protein, partial [Sphingomonadales bacterium]